MDTATLMWGLIFSSIGLGFFIYGKKQKMLIPMLCGIGLMLLPYFISSILTLIAISISLIALPYFIR